MKKSGTNEWQIFYHPAVVKDDIPNIASAARQRIKRSIENKLTANPALYGIPLRGTLRQYWKLRVGDWRVVFSINGPRVLILIIAHRRQVYKMAERRKSR